MSLPQFRSDEKIPKSQAERELDFEQLPAKNVYQWMNHLIAPRPIAFISSASASSAQNLAPFSYFNGVCSDPPLVSISISNKDDGKKDTLNNILETKEFCINLVAEWFADRMHETAYPFPPNVSEAKELGFELVACKKIGAMRVAASPANMECVLEKTIALGNVKSAGATTLVIGRIVYAHLGEDFLESDRSIDPKKVKAVGRLGGRRYVTITDFFDLGTPGANQKPE